jgi:hypothetical protein
VPVYEIAVEKHLIKHIKVLEITAHKILTVTMVNNEKRLIKANKLDVLDEKNRKHLEPVFEDRVASFYLKQNELECQLVGLLDTDRELQASFNNLRN